MNADILEETKQAGAAAVGIPETPLDGSPLGQTLVVSIITVRVEIGNARALLDEAFDVLQLESRNMPGFLGGELLVSLDLKTLVIRTEWSDTHAWSKSRYDGRVGMMLEHCSAVTKALDVEVYLRHAAFSSSLDAIRVDAVQKLIENNGWSPRITSCAE